jgi:hypothetical protein
MTEPSLAELLDGPTFTLRIGGADYRFGEIPVPSMLALEEWIKANSPHPIQAIKPYLDGLPPEERQSLLENARKDAKDWPPRVGTQAGSRVLMSSGDLGQIEVLYYGLLVHHKEATREHARGLHCWLERAMRREIAADPDGESPTVRRIYAAIFGMLDEQGEPISGPPKGEQTARNGESDGVSCSAAASNV